MKKILLMAFALLVLNACGNKESFAEELTAEEKMEIAKYQTAYSALRVKAGFKDFGKDIEEAAQKAKEALEAR